jgi:hypothetical protein
MRIGNKTVRTAFGMSSIFRCTPNLLCEKYVLHAEWVGCPFNWIDSRPSPPPRNRLNHQDAKKILHKKLKFYHPIKRGRGGGLADRLSRVRLPHTAVMPPIGEGGGCLGFFVHSFSLPHTYLKILLSANWQIREDAGFHFRHNPSPVARNKFSFKKTYHPY